MSNKLCSECRNGEVNEPAVAQVSHPNPDFPNLRVRKWVCAEHQQMLNDDYGMELRVLFPA